MLQTVRAVFSVHVSYDGEIMNKLIPVFANSGSVAAPVDYSAAGLSILCSLHCLALPVLAMAFPLAGVWAQAEWVHKALVLMAIPISGHAAFVRGAYFHDRAFVAIVTLGLALLGAAAFVESLHALEKPITVAGAFLVASSHLWRWRSYQKTQTKEK